MDSGSVITLDLIPTKCGHPPCQERVDRLPHHTCGGTVGAAGNLLAVGCGRYFCGDHLYLIDGIPVPLCLRCIRELEADGRAQQGPGRRGKKRKKGNRSRVTDTSKQGGNP